MTRSAIPARTPLFLHDDLCEWVVGTTTPLRHCDAIRRALLQLQSHGRPSRTKGMRGRNAGWRRIPLGGPGGSQFYLWLAHHGENLRTQREDARRLWSTLPRGAHVLRAVRHHDETDFLPVGAPSDYTRVALLGAPRT